MRSFTWLKFVNFLTVIVLLLGVSLEPVASQESEEGKTQFYLPLVSGSGDITAVEKAADGVDISALTLPVVEVRQVVPYGKDEASFGKIGIQPAHLRVPAATPIVVRLLASKLPKLNEAINLTLQVHAYKAASNIITEIALPAGVELLSGTPQTALTIEAGQQKTLTVAVVFKRVGEYAIIGKALSKINADMTWGDQDALYLTIGETVSQAGIASATQRQLQSGAAPAVIQAATAEETNGEVDDLLMDEDTQSIDAALTEDAKLVEAPQTTAAQGESEGEVNAAATNANVTISICWTLGSDRDGSVPALRDAYIQLWDRDTGGTDDLLATGYTGYSNGCRSFTVSNTDTDVCCTIDVYFRVHLLHSGRYRVTNYGGGTFYAETNVTFDVSANVDYGTWWMGGGSGNDRSVRIYNDLYRSRRFIIEQAVNDGQGGEPGFVHVLWETGGTDGTYYSLNDQKVHLADADSASRDTVVHEASHRYMHAVYANFPPFDCPSPHFITGASGKYCAWTEGYTYVFVAGADGNPTYVWPSGSSLNLETPVCSSAGWDDGPTVEGRVGGLLIDLADPILISFGTAAGFNNEGPATGCGGRDLTSGFFSGIWDLIYDQDDNVVTSQAGETNSFSNAWESRQYSRYAPHLTGHHNTIDLFTHD